MAFTHQAVLLILAAVGMQRVNLGRFEEYGEVISGGFIALKRPRQSTARREP